MFDADKMFEDSAAMIAAIARDPLAVPDTMRQWLQYCHDVAPDQAATWDSLATLDFDADFVSLTKWVSTVFANEPPNDRINCLRFGLCNPAVDGEPSLQMYISGTADFDATAPHADWAAGPPDFSPSDRYANSTVLPAIYQQVNKTLETDACYLGEAFLAHGYVAAVVGQWCHGPLRPAMIGAGHSRAVEIGHDGGDAYFIHLPGA